MVMSSRFEMAEFATREFFRATIDSLLSHIAVLSADGSILAVNAAWVRFGWLNGMAADFCWKGLNYLRVCDASSGQGADDGSLVADAIRDVAAGRLGDFTLEYPCHSPSEQRWFSARVTRFALDGDARIVVSHENITLKKLAEIALIEANRRLQRWANTDVLTGIANRRSFDRTLEKEWRRLVRDQSPLSLALIDVDCFKLYNDHAGHLAGDLALAAVARAIQSCLKRPGDFVARYGGEEFGVILPATDREGATSLLELILQAVRERAIPHAASKVPRRQITVSIGLASTIADRVTTASILLRQADEALYKAKALGRDRLVTFMPIEEPSAR